MIIDVFIRRNTGILRIKQSIKLLTAGMHPFGHCGLAKTLFIHLPLYPPREHPFYSQREAMIERALLDGCYTLETTVASEMTNPEHFRNRRKIIKMLSADLIYYLGLCDA